MSSEDYLFLNKEITLL